MNREYSEGDQNPCFFTDSSPSMVGGNLVLSVNRIVQFEIFLFFSFPSLATIS